MPEQVTAPRAEKIVAAPNRKRFSYGLSRRPGFTIPAAVVLLFLI